MKYLILTLFSILSFGQSSLKIKYTESTNHEQIRQFNYNGFLTLNDEKSQYFVDYNNQLNESDNLNLVVKSNKIPYYYKDYTTDSLYYLNNIIFKNFPTKDPISIFKWKLEKETKTILGYKCQRAIMSHYGRLYYAFFTTDLGFNKGGPWKFDGLPGVILEVYSLDEEFKIIANEINLENKAIVINNPYTDVKDWIDFNEYKRLYGIKYKENYKRSIDSSGNMSFSSMPKCQRECLVD